MSIAKEILLAGLFIMSFSGKLVDAQSVSGFTTVDVDPATGYVTATCETDLSPDASEYYGASVACTLYDGYGSPISSGSYSDIQGFDGYAQVVLVIPGVPGTVYSASGTHSADSLLLVDPDEPSPEFETGPQWWDFLGFGFFENQGSFYPNYFTLYAPGGQRRRSNKTITIGATKDTNVLYLDIPPIVDHAQQIFPARCDQVFANVIPGYSNTSFFQSLRATQFNQWPFGTPNTPPHGSSEDARTETQPGRPIDLWPNFYGYHGNLEYPTFHEFVLIHEGIHHFTGWSDQDFVVRFQSSGYRNTSGNTNDFTEWIRGGCLNTP